ncbi:MAG: hypothetical protein ACR2F6_00815 [Mycobacteriales bacterium]
MTVIRAGLQTAGRITDMFAAAGARGYLHARQIGGAGEGGTTQVDAAEVGVDAGEPVVLASVFKIAVALGLGYAVADADAVAVADGRLDPCERITVGPGDRLGG